MPSHMALLQYSTGLVGLIGSNQKVFKITEIDGTQMVSINGVPWLGPEMPGNAQVACTIGGHLQDTDNLAASDAYGGGAGCGRAARARVHVNGGSGRRA